MEKLHRHFSRLFASTDSLDHVNSVPASVHPKAIKWKTGPFTHDELASALSCAKGGKAPGIDNITNEILKTPGLEASILGILNDMRNQVLPEQKVSILVPIPKPKGDRSDPANWRGICLMPHVTKLFDRMILNRVRAAVDDHLHHSQNGFREGRGTNHHVMAPASVHLTQEVSDRGHLRRSPNDVLPSLASKIHIPCTRP
eukprot:PhF_6_TR13256/c2_g2_i2/m.21021